MPDVKMKGTMLDDRRDAVFSSRTPFLTYRGSASQETIDLLICKQNPFVLCVRTGVDYLADVCHALAKYKQNMKLILSSRLLFASQSKFTYHNETITGLSRSVTLTANMYFFSIVARQRYNRS